MNKLLLADKSVLMKEKLGKSLGGSYSVAVAGDHHHHHHNHNHFYHLYAGYLQLYMFNKSGFYGI